MRTQKISWHDRPFVAVWGWVFAVLGAAACGLDAGHGSSSAAVHTGGTVTQLCGYTPENLPSYPTWSPDSVCEGACYSQVTNGFCNDPADAGSRVEVYGCAGKTNGAQCDGSSLGNGGQLIDTVNNGQQVSFSHYWHLTQFCTFQIDIMRPGDPKGDANGNVDFIIWQRDECDASPPPPQPPVAECSDVTVCASPDMCVASASIDNGSYHPDGNSISISQTPPGPYSIGDTDVTLTVSDGQLSDTCHGTVHVNDCDPPEITCPEPVVVECQGNFSADVDPGCATAEDCSEIVYLTKYGVGSYPLGITSLLYTAIDAHGNQASCESSVTVEDTTPPQIVQREVPKIGPPLNGQYHRITLADCVESLIDECTGPLSVYEHAAIIRVSSDEPDDLPNPNRLNDIIIVDLQTVDLRAEREPAGNGRVYVIEFRVWDSAGNELDGLTCKVPVDHDNGPNGGAIEDPPDHYVYP